MPEWRRHGLLAFTINLQGGSPQGYSKDAALAQLGVHGRRRRCGPSTWPGSSASSTGPTSWAWSSILGVFYFGQDERLQGRGGRDRAASTTPSTGSLDQGYRNVLIEIEQRVQRPLRPRDPQARPRPRADRARQDATRDGRRFLVGTSYGGGTDPEARTSSAPPTSCCCTATASSEPERIAEMVPQDPRRCRATGRCRSSSTRTTTSTSTSRRTTSPRPSASTRRGATSTRAKNDYRDGYQSPPVHWGLNTHRKRAFFALLKQVTGS